MTTNLAFNLGKTRLSKFKGYFRAVKAGDYKRAAAELQWRDPDDHGKGTTPYWDQVGYRGLRLAARLNNIGG